MDEWRKRYANWRREHRNINDVAEYPWVKNRRAPFTPARSALSMLNLGLVSSAGAYIDGTTPFDLNDPDGDFAFREIPVDVEAEDLRFAARGYPSTAVESDINVQVPLERLAEFEANRIIGQLNPVFWSFSGFIPNAGRMVDDLLPGLIERLNRYELQAVLLIPASNLCHQSCSLLARAIEQAGIPTMTLGVLKEVVETVRPPRAGVYEGEIGSVSGRPNFPEHQRRVLDEALRLIEPLDQPAVRQLVVELETHVEVGRGER